MMYICYDHVILFILYVDLFVYGYALDYNDNIRCNVYLNVILCEVGHWLLFLVEANWLSDVMGSCLVITPVDLTTIHDYLSWLSWY